MSNETHPSPDRDAQSAEHTLGRVEEFTAEEHMGLDALSRRVGDMSHRYPDHPAVVFSAGVVRGKRELLAKLRSTMDADAGALEEMTTEDIIAALGLDSD